MIKLPNPNLQNYPPERRWQQVKGAADSARPDHQPGHLVSIGGLDHAGEWTSIWTDLPNAMYLLHILLQVQRATGVPVVTNEPGPMLPPLEGFYVDRSPGDQPPPSDHMTSALSERKADITFGGGAEASFSASQNADRMASREALAELREALRGLAPRGAGEDLGNREVIPLSPVQYAALLAAVDSALSFSSIPDSIPWDEKVRDIIVRLTGILEEMEPLLKQARRTVGAGPHTALSERKADITFGGGAEASFSASQNADRMASREALAELREALRGLAPRGAGEDLGNREVIPLSPVQYAALLAAVDSALSFSSIPDSIPWDEKVRDIIVRLTGILEEMEPLLKQARRTVGALLPLLTALRKAIEAMHAAVGAALEVFGGKADDVSKSGAPHEDREGGANGGNNPDA